VPGVDGGKMSSIDPGKLSSQRSSYRCTDLAQTAK
jgi:hypothetical protein